MMGIGPRIKSTVTELSLIKNHVTLIHLTIKIFRKSATIGVLMKVKYCFT
jgi:hypothetical protein